jgi:hypothetical protein
MKIVGFSVGGRRGGDAEREEGAKPRGTRESIDARAVIRWLRQLRPESRPVETVASRSVATPPAAPIVRPLSEKIVLPLPNHAGAQLRIGTTRGAVGVELDVSAVAGRRATNDLVNYLVHQLVATRLAERGAVVYLENGASQWQRLDLRTAAPDAYFPDGKDFFDATRVRIEIEPRGRAIDQLILALDVGTGVVKNESAAAMREVARSLEPSVRGSPAFRTNNQNLLLYDVGRTDAPQLATAAMEEWIRRVEAKFIAGPGLGSGPQLRLDTWRDDVEALRLHTRSEPQQGSSPWVSHLLRVLTASAGAFQVPQVLEAILGVLQSRRREAVEPELSALFDAAQTQLGIRLTVIAGRKVADGEVSARSREVVDFAAGMARRAAREQDWRMTAPSETIAPAPRTEPERAPKVGDFYQGRRVTSVVYRGGLIPGWEIGVA